MVSIITLLALAELLGFVTIFAILELSLNVSILANYLMLLLYGFRIIIPAAFTDSKTDQIILSLFEIQHIVRRLQDCTLKLDKFLTLHENITQ